MQNGNGEGMEIRRSIANPVKVHIALIVVWAAVTAASRVIAIPAMPLWGIGKSFTLASVFTPLAGIFFGPIYGFMCAAASGIIGLIVSPQVAWAGILTWLIGASTAFVSGCVAWGSWPPVKVNAKGNFVINGGIIVFALGTVLWFSNEMGRSVPYFAIVFYGLGFTALLIGCVFSARVLAARENTVRNIALKFTALFLCSYAGRVGSSSLANFMSFMIYDVPKETWMALTFVAPVERAIFSIGTAIVGLPLLANLPKLGIFIGPQENER